MTREEAIEILCAYGVPQDEKGFREALDMAIEALSSDAVEVVRCKDCIYYHPSFCEIWSKYGTVQTRELGYCYMGERRKDGE